MVLLQELFYFAFVVEAASLMVTEQLDCLVGLEVLLVVLEEPLVG